MPFTPVLRMLRRQHKRRQDRRQKPRPPTTLPEAGGGVQLPGGQRPNVILLMGDDIGQTNISSYSLGMCGYDTPNIDRIGQEGGIFTDAYGQNSCTAGRCAFLTGQTPFRQGLLNIGFPGSHHGIANDLPTLGNFLRDLGYRTGQFGKNHFGDNNRHLPTMHGFDEFYGILYHLNATEEPYTYYYPRDDEAFVARYGPRGLIKSEWLGNGQKGQGPEDERYGPTGPQNIEDLGPTGPEVQKTLDDDVTERACDFIRRNKDGPFFLHWAASRCHVHTHLKDESKGVTGISTHADAMVEHDGHVGRILQTLDELGLMDNTIIAYTTDNGPESAMWPDGAVAPFINEKGTTWEGGVRVPFLMRIPGVLDDGRWVNEIWSLEDIVPTVMACCGQPEFKEEVKEGYTFDGYEGEYTVKIYMDGFNFLPFFAGQEELPPRDRFLYFTGKGELNAVRWEDWKISFAAMQGNIANGSRTTTNWPMITNLRADPFERMPSESFQWGKWYSDLMWLFIPVGQIVSEFVETVTSGQYSFHAGSSSGPADLNYNTLQMKQLIERLAQPGEFASPFE